MEEQELEVWKPPVFEGGRDMLPLQAAEQGVTALIEEHDVEAEDMILPQVNVLQGLSKPIADGVEGAKVGMLDFGGEFIAPPVRLLIIHRVKGYAMFVRKGKEYEGLEDCFSRDGVTGSKYGDCGMCCKCHEWRESSMGEKNLPPLGTTVQQFVVWSDRGLFMLRWSISNKHSRRYFRELQTNKTTSQRNWFAHPMLLDVSKETNEDNQPFFVPRMRWQLGEVTPPGIQTAAHKWYDQICQALEHGKLKAHDDETDQRGPKRPTAQPDYEGEVPF